MQFFKIWSDKLNVESLEVIVWSDKVKLFL